MYFRLVENYYPYIFMSERHENVNCDMHMHSSPEIILVSEGVLNMSVRGINYEIHKGEAVFVAPCEAHSFRSEKDNKCHVLMFSRELLSYLSDYLKKNEIVRHIFAPTPNLLSLVDTYLPKAENYASPRLAEAVVSPFLYEVFEGCEFKERKEPYEDRLLIALEHIQRNFNVELTLEDVARVAGMHPVTLSKSFSKRTGTTFGSFLKFLRATHAAYLIRTEKVTFTEVAIRAGFGSVRSFNRAFFEIYGITPTEYREREGRKRKKPIA